MYKVFVGMFCVVVDIIKIFYLSISNKTITDF